MTSRVRLSVLDQTVVVAGRSEADAVTETLALARHCETLGYARFWLSEHHGLPTLAGSAPEVLMAAVAAVTTRIRVGSAGVMLPHYAALKVAEQFNVLNALAPGRIDLGVGRAPGSDRRTALALNPHAAAGAADFPQQVVDLRAWTEGRRHHGLLAHPLPAPGTPAPELWVLGSSDYGARLAAALGLPYAFAWFFADGQGADEALALYRALWQPGPRHAAPQPTVCVWALAADSDEAARHHALSRDRWRLDRLRGVPGPLRAPGEIAAEGFGADETDALRPMRRAALVGRAEDVAARIQALAERLGLEEVVVNTWAHDPAVRRHSYALLARAFGTADPAAVP